MADRVETKPSFLRRNTACLIGACPFVQNSDNTACWGECTICGKRSGYVTRAAIRRYIDRQDEVTNG